MEILIKANDRGIFINLSGKPNALEATSLFYGLWKAEIALNELIEKYSPDGDMEMFVSGDEEDESE